MKNLNQLFFPCLESPLKLYLSVATAGEEESSLEVIDPSAASDTNEPEETTETADEAESSSDVKKAPPSTTTEEEEPTKVVKKSTWQDKKHEYLSLHTLNKKKVCVSDTPHEWCLLWNNNTKPTTATVLDQKEDSFDDDDDEINGIRASTFVLQSVDRKVFLTCNAEGDLSTCTKEYLQAKQQQQFEQEQEEELILQEDNAAANTTSTAPKGGDDQGSFTWALEYEDESGMVVSLINTTYQRKLAILKSSSSDGDGGGGTNNNKPMCTTLPLATKILEDEDDAHLFPGGDDDDVPPPSTPQFTFHWKMRFRSGELLFLSNPTIQRRLRCDAFGKLTCDENWKGWEVFRFVEAGHGGYVQIASWTHDSYLLYSNQYGKVGMTQKSESPNTLWAITRFRGVDGTPGGVLLRSVRHDRYLSALSETELATVEEQNFNFAAVQWELEAANKNIFFLTTTTATAAASKSSSPNGTVSHHFLSSRQNGKVFSTKHGKDWEEWELKPVLQEGKSLEEEEEEDRKPPAAGGFAEQVNLFSIYSSKHQKYLGSSEDGNVYTIESLGESEYWELEESPSGDGYILVSHLYGDRQLFCNDKGELATSADECQAWNLQPRMPSSISKNQMAVAGVAAATLLVASPLSLALGAVARAPFAAMMVGGAEVVTAEAAVAYGVGTAVLGTSAVAIMSDHKSRLESKKSQQNELPIHSVNRPLVGWRSW
mmetsp:Transcript_22461/g.55584  ORF Transcript_22461/g.55584 Transcript_22461/m.55584 type:complete len:712 (+) Transcript_22461:106-2241(+)